MIKFAGMFLILALLAGAFGFTAGASLAAGIAKIMFFILLVVMALLIGAAFTGGRTSVQ